MNLKVSIIIPAYNAAATIEETLRSIMAQTYDDWEAIVVDDGSRDDTLQVVHAIDQLDGRIRHIQQAHAGVSAARNRGLIEAVADWVLFLDADDLILERHLEHLVERTWGEPAPDVILSGWSRVAQAGNRLKAERMMADHLTMEAIMRYCPPIHAFLVRREIVEKVGGFDSALRTCEDMDLWIRVIRAGSTFCILEEASALYRFRVDSASSDGLRLLEDGLAVLARAHQADPPVLQPALQYALGRPEPDLSEEAYYFLCWCAGLELGRGVDARKLLDKASVGVCCNLESDFISHRLFYAVALFSPQEAHNEASFWIRRIQLAEKFLTALERRSLTAGLARSSGAALEKLVIENVVSLASCLIGKSLALELEVARPVYDIHTSPSVERVLCRVNLDGNVMGMLELPVIGGMISKYVLSDAIADEFGWKILDQFLQSNVYGSLLVTETENHKIVSRHGVVLTDSIPVDSPALAPFLHQRAGWALFLQEIWAQRDRPLAWFYDAAIEEKAERTEQVENDWLQIEVSEPLPDLMGDYSLLQVLVTVGGVAIGVVPITSQEGMVTAHRLRTEITRATGFELCRAAVREGLLDRPISGQGTLQQRLVSRAVDATRMEQIKPSETGDAVLFSPATCTLFQTPSMIQSRNILLGRRSGPIDSAVSRRAELPLANVSELLEVSAHQEEPVLQFFRQSSAPERVIYAPDFCWKAPDSKFTRGDNAIGNYDRAIAWRYDRSYFEAVFARSADPWRYTTEYEQIKYAQTFALLPERPLAKALEIGCAEGHFTMQLARRVSDLVTADISHIALERAAARCAGLQNVSFLPLDLKRDPLPGTFDLVVCSEVLYFMDDYETLIAACRKLTGALERGGYLLVAHANLVVDEPGTTGFDWDFPFGARTISDVIQRFKSVALRKEIRTPLYRIQLYQRRPRLSSPFRRSTADVTPFAEPLALPHASVATTIRWNGIKETDKRHKESAVTTSSLPILMYHHIGAHSGGRNMRYWLDPRQFEEQLSFLRETGYYSISLDQWQAAMEKHEPLPGRAVVITFDDGYRNFLTEAWPLLKRYGLTAAVFLVSAKIGQTNTWDRCCTETVPLLDWGEIRQLRAAGTEFGAHASDHVRLTSLSPIEIVREAITSRLSLEKGLGERISAFAYPYGAEDPVVHHLIGACGYRFGLTCRSGKSGLWDRPLVLPRIEIRGDENFADFVLKMETG